MQYLDIITGKFLMLRKKAYATSIVLQEVQSDA